MVQTAAAPEKLPRTLGLWSSVGIVVGITIGSGIFRSPAGIARLAPSPLVMMGLWIAGGIVTLCGALSLAEIAAALPQTGGIYAYIREAWGRQAAFLFGWAELVLIRASALGGVYDRLTGLLTQFSIDLSDLALRATNWFSDQIVGQVTSIARNALLSVLNFILMLVALWFFFRDGEAMAQALRDLIPMEPAHKDVVFARLYTTLTAVVQSMVVVAVTQGFLAGLGYWLIGGLDFSVFLGFVTGFASFLPLAGPALVWSGASLYLFFIGEVGRAIGLAVWGLLAVSTADNWIKPIFIGGRAQLPTSLLLIALLGGLQVYGFLGVFLGPVILALLLTFVAIYRDLYVAPPMIQPAVPAEPPAPRIASA